MPNVRLLLEYNGSGFHGWQRQPDQRTIQSELERVLEIVTREKVEIIGSGRTDAGVHALGQVANFHISTEPDLDKLSQSVSSLLRSELSIVAASFVSEDFHARHSATGKRYLYRILNRRAPSPFWQGYSWQLFSLLNIDQMNSHAEVLVGEHDFSSFRGAICGARSPIKTVRALSIAREGDLVLISVEGTGFLKQMVRNIVGTLVDLTQGRLGDVSMASILEQKSRPAAGITAPAQGLYLETVYY